MRKRCFPESDRKVDQKCDRSVCCLTIRPLEPLNNREQNSIIQSKIPNLKSKIGRSHLRKFHQKCDRSVCCLTIRALDPLNNREQRSIIQSKIPNPKSKIDRLFNRKSQIENRKSVDRPQPRPRRANGCYNRGGYMLWLTLQPVTLKANS